jgi:hypothetical protein
MPASFASLSNETLLGICAWLCHHCYSDPTTFYRELDDDRVEVKHRQIDLANFALSCRRLYYVAIPFLYHMPRPSNPRQAIRLLHTLAHHPGLAEHVKVLRLWCDSWGIKRDDIAASSSEDISFSSLLAMADLQKDDRTLKDGFSYDDRGRIQRTRDPSPDEEDEIDIFEKPQPVPLNQVWEPGERLPNRRRRALAYAMAISFTSKLERLEIQLPWEDGDHRILLPRIASLQHIKEVAVIGDDNTQPSETADIEQLRSLLAYMPSLTVLRLYFLRFVYPLPMPADRVQDLFLTEITTLQEIFDKIMSKNFPRLRLCSWNESFNGDDAQAVSNVRFDDIPRYFARYDPSTLRHLRLNIRNGLRSEAIMSARRWIRRFSSLETLDIVSSFPTNRGSEDGPDGVALYTNILPSSLRALSLVTQPLSTSYHTPLWMWRPHIRRLRHIAESAERFPNLRMVRFRLLDAHGQPVVDGDAGIEGLALSDVFHEFEERNVLIQREDGDLWTFF